MCLIPLWSLIFPLYVHAVNVAVLGIKIIITQIGTRTLLTRIKILIRARHKTFSLKLSNPKLNHFWNLNKHLINCKQKHVFNHRTLRHFLLLLNSLARSRSAILIRIEIRQIIIGIRTDLNTQHCCCGIPTAAVVIMMLI